MVTIGHLREAWRYALSEIDAAIVHLESNAGEEALPSIDEASRAAAAWLVNLRRDHCEYNALLTNFPLVF